MNCKFRIQAMDPVEINLQNMAYEDIYDYIEHNGSTLDRFIVAHVDGNKFFIGTYVKSIERVGKRYFKKLMKTNEFSRSSNGKIYGDSRAYFQYCGSNIFNRNGNNEYINLLKGLGVEWCIDAPVNLVGKRSIAADIITGKYTNLESLVKTYVRRHLRGAFAWKDVVEYYRNNPGISLYDILDFTTNPNLALHRIMSSGKNDFFQPDSILIDAIRGAVKLNELVNPIWSEKRLNEEHVRQIRMLNQKQINSKSPEPLYSEKVQSLVAKKDIELINTEQRCFQEGMLMTNCSYSLHWQYLRNRSRIMFHMTNPEVATIEFFREKEFTFSEARGMRNVTLQDETLQIINDFMAELNSKNVCNAILDDIIKDMSDGAIEPKAVEPAPTDWGFLDELQN